MADALLVYNPAAGRVWVRPFIGGVIRALNDYGWRVEVAESVNGRHTTQLAHLAAQEKYALSSPSAEMGRPGRPRQVLLALRRRWVCCRQERPMFGRWNWA